MSDFIVAIGLVLVIEGILYAAFPGFLKKALEMLAGMPESQTRMVGLTLALAGITIVWLVRG